MPQKDDSIHQLKGLREQKSQRNQKMKIVLRKLREIGEKIDRQKSLQVADRSLKNL